MNPQMPKLAVLSLVSLLVPAYASDQSMDQLSPTLDEQPHVQIQRNTDGNIRNLRFDKGHVFKLSTNNGKSPLDPVAAAQQFVRENADLFGLNQSQAVPGVDDLYARAIGAAAPSNQFTLIDQSQKKNGDSFIHLQQNIDDIPVFGGEIIVQLNAAMRVSAVQSNLSVIDDAVKMHDDPSQVQVDAQRAMLIARQVMAKYFPARVNRLTFDKPSLWLLDPSVVAVGLPRLTGAWRIEASGETASKAVHQLLFIDAQNGALLWRSSLIPTLKDRRIYDNRNEIAWCTDSGLNCLPGLNLSRAEGDPEVDIGDVDKAYDFAGDAHDFYQTYHNRDSIDNEGLPIVTTVRFCETGQSCPYTNAFWSSKHQQTVYGEGLVTDDIVAHEFTHGVTEYESSLIYFMQSGAINEAFSDMWGEWVDQQNNAGNDQPEVRWLIGEDSPVLGAIRNMKNPSQFNDPDRVNSPLYACLPPSADSRSLHINNGVGNKAAYLLTDGDTFNGYTVKGLGFEKTAKIFYEVQTNLLPTSASYADLAAAMRTACSNLTGTAGISSDDCAQVDNAINAVEMEAPVCYQPPPPLCDGVTDAPQSVFFDDFENGDTRNWSSTNIQGSNTWRAFLLSSGDRQNHALYGASPDGVSDAAMATNNPVRIPANGYLYISHFPLMEALNVGIGLDGGVLEYSTDGRNWQDAGQFFDNNGYDYTLLSGSNPLVGRQAFVEQVGPSFTGSRLNLQSLVGQNVWFRFRIGTDSTVSYSGWFIDNFHIYSCRSSGDNSSSDNSSGNDSSTEDSSGATSPLILLGLLLLLANSVLSGRFKGGRGRLSRWLS